MRPDCHLLFQQLLNGRPIQNSLRCFGSREPGVADGARGLPVGTLDIGRRIVHELVRDDGPLECRHDVAQGELARIASQLMTAMRPAHTAHDAPPPQSTQKLIEVSLGNLLAGRNLGTLNWPLTVSSGQLDDRVSTVVAAHRQSHC